jgi:hypothetical protein
MVSLAAGFVSDVGILALHQRFQLRVLHGVIATSSHDVIHVLQAAEGDADTDLVLFLPMGRNSCRELYRTVHLPVGVQFIQQFRKLYPKRKV